MILGQIVGGQFEKVSLQCTRMGVRGGFFFLFSK